MTELTLAEQILHSIVYQSVLFKDALRDTFPKDSPNREYSSTVSAIVGCELRHHRLFGELLKKVPLEYDEQDICLIYCAFSNNYFLKRLPVADVNNFLKDSLKEKYVAQLNDLLVYEGSIIELLETDENKNSIEFISIRFNTPTWLVKMWQKHFGRGLTFRILKKNIRPESQTCRVNTLKISSEEFAKKYPDFGASAVPDIYLYNGKVALRRTEAYRDYDIFLEKLALKDAVDKHFKDDFHDVFVYSGADDSIVREMMVKCGGKIGLNVGVPSLDDRASLLRLVRLQKAKNINLFECADPLSMDAAVATKQDLVIAFPKSSSFDQVRQYPDFFIQFNRADIDKCIENQAAVLEGCAKHVIDDGVLLYIVDTLDKKESKSITSEFILKHPEYELIEDKQYFPFDSLDSAFFVAAFHKKVEEVKK